MSRNQCPHQERPSACNLPVLAKIEIYGVWSDAANHPSSQVTNFTRNWGHWFLFTVPLFYDVQVCFSPIESDFLSISALWLIAIGEGWKLTSQQCTMHNVHCTLHNAHFTMYIAHIVHCTMHTMKNTPSISDHTLPTLELARVRSLSSCSTDLTRAPMAQGSKC